MSDMYPSPEEVGIKSPSDVDEELFLEGWYYGLQSNTLKMFKKSFGQGFRMSKIFLNQLQREQGVITFPLQGKFTVKFK